MFIIWGKKRRAVNRGTAAEFCPVCRGLRACKARELHLVPHLYFVPIGRGEVVAAEVECRDCGWFRDVPLSCVQRATKERSVNLDLLATTTSVLGADAVAERLGLEKRALRGSIGPAERSTLLREPFESLNYRTAVMRLRGKGESMIAVVAAVLVFAMFGAAIGWHELLSPGRHEPWQVWTAWISAGIIAVTLPATVWLMIRSKRHAARCFAVPMLARALRPLKPSLAELEAVMEECRGMPSVEGVTARRLMDLMERERARGLRAE